MNKKPKKPLKNLIILSGIGIQMGVIIFLGAYGGKWLDAYYQTEKKYFTIACTLFAVAISLYVVLKQVNKIHK